MLASKGGLANLGAAIAANDITQVQELIETNPALIEARFDILSCRGARSLAVAAGYKRTEIVKMLIDAGADINADNDLALFMAHANPTIMQLLTSHGAQVNPYPNAPCSPLVFACEIQDITSVKFLLSKGANPNACVYSEFRYGNPINPQQGWKNPALWLTKSRRQISPLLVALGTPFGNYPHKKESDWWFLPEIVEVLICAGADLSAKHAVLTGGEEIELTPLGYALNHEDAGNANCYQKAIEVLRKYGAPE